MRGIAAACALLTLCACGSERSDLTKQEIKDIVAEANRSSPGLAQRVATLEAEVAYLRAEHVKDLQFSAKMATADVDAGRYNDEAFKRLFSNDEAIRARVNWLLLQQGAAPIPKVD